MNVKCYQCGKVFRKKPSHVRERNFCSRECYYEFKGLTKVNVVCERCGKEFSKSPSLVSERNYCSRQCHMKTMNEELNPTRMGLDTRVKLRNAHLGCGSGQSYEKTFGRHTHRVVAEQILGRRLKPKEVVHHIDGNKRNNSHENLMIFSCQAEHAKWHVDHDREVMPFEVHTT